MGEQIFKCFENIFHEIHRVIDGIYNNNAENYHSIRAKLDHGKYRNYIQGGSFEIRSYCAALYFNEGVNWIFDLLENCHLFVDPVTINAFKKIETKKNRNKLWKINNPKVKFEINKVKSDKIDTNYGPGADIYDDEKMLFELFENMNKLMESINVDQQKRDEIIELTKKQRNDPNWYEERQKRISASNFGKVAKKH